jgi:hypothetical protein
MNEVLRTIELKHAEAQQALAKLIQANAALQRFWAKGPRPRKKSGRPPFWKSRHGLLFVREVDDFAHERNCKVAFAIKTIRDRWCRSGSCVEKSVKVALEKPSHEALQVRYQEARQYWLFVLDLESYRQQDQSLQRNFDEASAALSEITTAVRYLIQTARIGDRGLPRLFVRNSGLFVREFGLPSIF